MRYFLENREGSAPPPPPRYAHAPTSPIQSYKIQEFYSPILGPARAYKDDANEIREIQTIEWKIIQAITMYDIFVPEI